MELDKIQPHALELESAILGGCMLEPAALNDILPFFDPQVFYSSFHVNVAKCILELRKEGIHPDIMLVTEQMRKTKRYEEGDAYKISVMTSQVVSTANIEYHYRIVQQKYVQREFIRIMHEKIRDAYDPSCDIFDLLEDAEKKLRKINPVNKETWEQTSEEISDNVLESVINSPTSSGIYMFYNIGWPKFDKYVSTARNKIITVGGASGHGKSRFVSGWMFRLLDAYPKDVSIFWCSFEDSSEDLLLFYLSYRMKIKAKKIKRREFDKALIPEIKEHIERFKSYDIHVIDKSSRVSYIRNKFELFCDRRPGKFPILILDNILSTKDKADFRGNDNAMEDYVMNELVLCKQQTHALIIPVHHYSKSTFKDRNESGYRPMPEDLKGSERIQAVSNQILLINNPKIYKELLSQYDGDAKEILKHIFIVDPGKIRDDSNDDDTLIHFWSHMDSLTFEEIN